MNNSKERTVEMYLLKLLMGHDIVMIKIKLPEQIFDGHEAS